ncbi:DUF4058 family protein [Armatimonas sp.]|uniref:DUF4058 family protein n=1 Tax=Armatimonas sp. TaxID=1872638 RepID=UPI00374C9894
MPSPFPGMDPYLEAPDMWRGTQKGLLVMLCAAINRQLPEPFCTLVTERLIPDESFIEPLSELCIEIKNRFVPGRPTVSVIEVFTHIHKSAGRGRDEYLAKQKILLESDVHLLEIDFLRSGEHTLATSKTEIEEHCGLLHYAASLHRGGYGQRFQAVAWTVQDRLPTVLVPLDEAHPDIEIDLQLVFERTYDEGGFDRMVDYAKPPEQTLPENLATWTATLLQSQA